MTLSRQLRRSAMRGIRFAVDAEGRACTASETPPEPPKQVARIDVPASAWGLDIAPARAGEASE